MPYFALFCPYVQNALFWDIWSKMGYFTNLAILVILVILVNSTYSANIWILVDFTNLGIFGNLVILVKFGIYVKKCYFCISTGISILVIFV